jgi:hypothetical protein
MLEIGKSPETKYLSLQNQLADRNYNRARKKSFIYH